MNYRATERGQLFVYGTLRAGGTLAHEWLPDSIVQRRDAVVRDAALYVPGHRAYPVMVRKLGAFVVGEIVEWDTADRETNERVADLVTMETNAGYTIGTVQAWPLAWHEPAAECAAFFWEHGTRDAVRIAHGDWLKFHNEDLQSF